MLLPSLRCSAGSKLCLYGTKKSLPKHNPVNLFSPWPWPRGQAPPPDQPIPPSQRSPRLSPSRSWVGVELVLPTCDPRIPRSRSRDSSFYRRVDDTRLHPPNPLENTALALSFKRKNGSPCRWNSPEQTYLTIRPCKTSTWTVHTS